MRCPCLSASPLYRWLNQPSDLGNLGDPKSRFNSSSCRGTVLCPSRCRRRRRYVAELCSSARLGSSASGRDPNATQDDA